MCAETPCERAWAVFGARITTISMATGDVTPFGDTNYINRAQIRYVYKMKHSALSLYLVYLPIGHGLCNTYI